MSKSKIEWTEKTWNPCTGCTKIAPGCKNCYAEAQHSRMRVLHPKKYDHDFDDVRCHPEVLEEPLRWRKAQRVFVNSMSDLFHDDVPFDFVDRVICITQDAPQHTYQIATKRPTRMRDYFSAGPPPPNVWGIYSASTQDDLERGIDDLLATPLAVRGLSLEPLLGPIVLEGDADKIRWVIVGGESGPHRRPCHRKWVLDIRDQCAAAGVPLFVKQIHDMRGRVVKMPELDGKVWAEYPR